MNIFKRTLLFILIILIIVIQTADSKRDRVFKPKFCISSYWGQNNDYYGAKWNASRSSIENDISNWKNAGVDGAVIIIHVSYNYNTKQFYICENLDDMEYAIKKLQEKNISVNAIKLHNNFTKREINDATDSLYESSWLGFINLIGNRFKKYNIPLMTIMNEFSVIYNDKNYVFFVINCINSAKALGYKVSITTTNNDSEWLNMPDDICGNLDYLCINFYPCLIKKNTKVTYSECLHNWCSQIFLDKVKNLINKYPNTKFIVSECGVQDYMIALSQPSRYSWESKDCVSTGGIAQSMFMLGMFEYLNNNAIDQVWWWYGISNNEPTNNIIKHYLGSY